MLEKLTLNLVVVFILIYIANDLIKNQSSIHDNQIEFCKSNKSSLRLDSTSNYRSINYASQDDKTNSFILFVSAKGVAGLGKAGGDGSGGSDKAGQQVPPEVYNALTYAGSAFLLTLSVPLILYGLNKLLNRVEDCFGCGPSKRRQKRKEKALAAMNAAAEAAAFNQPNQLQQQLQNQKYHLQMQQSFKTPGQSLLSSVDNNHNDNNVASQQQSISADNKAIDLQFNSEPQYKTLSLMQSNFQQPFIVSQPSPPHC